jgi:hypothetical protein
MNDTEQLRTKTTALEGPLVKRASASASTPAVGVPTTERLTTSCECHASAIEQCSAPSASKPNAPEAGFEE